MCDPEITVAALIEQNGRFLLVEERIDGRLLLNQPAGHLEHDETLLAALVREVREESAWAFVPEQLLGVYLWQHPVTQRRFKRFAFTGTVHDHRHLQPLDAGIVSTCWLTPAEVRARSGHLRSPLVLRCIEDYLRGTTAALQPVGHYRRQDALAAPAIAL